MRYAYGVSQNNALSRRLFGAVDRFLALTADILNMSTTNSVMTFLSHHFRFLLQFPNVNIIYMKG
jgi:hypothetical protein